LPDTAREQITVAIAMTDALDTQMAPIDKQLGMFARRQPGTRALMAHYGIGTLTSVVILAELGDVRRFSSSQRAVRYAVLDITRPPIRPAPRPRASLPPRAAGAAVGALFQAVQAARRAGSPDRDYYTQAAQRLGSNRACLALPRKLLERSYHTPPRTG